MSKRTDTSWEEEIDAAAGRKRANQSAHLTMKQDIEALRQRIIALEWANDELRKTLDAADLPLVMEIKV